MTPEQESLILALVWSPGRRPMPREEFLRRFGAADGVALGLDLLREAIDRRYADGVELALIVCGTFGSEVPLQTLIGLAFADWHRKHEDMASLLGERKSPEAVDALAHLARWVPEYLAFDDARALAVNAIWGLGAIPGDAARVALESIAESECEIVARNAREQLRRRAAREQGQG